MKILTVPTLASIGTYLLILSDLVPDVAAVPKTSWARQRAKGVGRRSLRASFDKRASSNSTGNSTTDDCVVQTAASVEAPGENIWGGLTDNEAASVVHWLFAQPELNLTSMEDAGDWDNVL